MTVGLALLSPDIIERRILLAVEFVDPVTGLLAGAAMRVKAAGFAPPTVTRAGQVVWAELIRGTAPPPPRPLAFEAVAADGRFESHSAVVNLPKSPPVHRVVLTPTGLYPAPSGRLAAAGMLIDDANTRAPIADATAMIGLQSRNDGTALAGGYTATTDARGGFIAFVGDLGSDAPTPLAPPAPEGGLVAWLSFTRAGTTRHTPLIPVRQGRTYRAPAPFVWAALSVAPPALPAP